MKKSNQNRAIITKSLFFILFFLTGIANAQIVNIPDANFKAALIAYGVDTNNDGQIQVSEAQAMNVLQFTNPIFTDTNGLESFINVINFYIQGSLVTSLNLSPLTQLESVICNNNSQLTTINFNGLTNLTGIEINGNSAITSLDVSGLTNLNNLNCNNNSQLTTLNLSGTNNIQTLDCSYNQLISLDVSNSTNLISLDCRFNQLTNLNITNCPVLDNINIDFNSLTTLDLTGLNSITFLYCAHNQISQVIFPENIIIDEFMCSYNQLVELDCSSVKFLSTLDLRYNPLQSLNIKNGYNENVNMFYPPDTSNTIFICQDENQIVSFNNTFINNGWTNIVCNSYCSFSPGGNYNTIAGNIKYDLDNNGCDVNDLIQPNIRVNINDGTTTGASFTDVNGNYKFYTQAGNFALTPAIENPSWFNVSPTTANVVFANNNNNTSTNDFCLSANGVHPDIEMVIVPIIPAQPGFDAIYRLVYRNKGNQTNLIFPNFNYDATKLQFVSSSVAPVLADNGHLGWQIFNVKPFQNGSIDFTLHVNAPTDTPAVNIGDVLTFTSFVDVGTDENWANNAFTYNQTVVGSYDPNDITCLEGDVVSPTEIGNYLHYNIRFENTGTAPAENIVAKVIVNSTDFDINSLQLMNTSHPVDARINGNIVEFIFQSINLESGGHGNVLLKVKSKSNLQQGDIVEKKAEIYFDYNFPVETNNAETVFQLLNNPGFEQDNTIKIHPNPAQNTVYINGNFSIKTVELYDAQGRLLQSSMINENETTMDITNKSKGVYFVKVSTEKGIRVEKLVKN